ncbi:HLIP/One helix protein [Hibiscus syriacus]|uniref:HLIP/One helix protein n=1 Tax=Hibiscus syriacus TaxID=106335 RepID=A0A6A2ZZQ0_HIBSY|nr:HLIP/One helix protein [Hibiscus syriacus]
MENLLCDEVWLSSPETEHSTLKDSGYADSFYTTKEDAERAIVICLEKELSYMPEPAYLHYLQSNNLVLARFRAVQWLIKTCSRLNFSIGTVFSAVNYLDRFISTSQCHGWKNWMVELLSTACLSIASKINEISLASMDELQCVLLTEDGGLGALFSIEHNPTNGADGVAGFKWRLSSPTTYSYIELITSNIICDLSYYLHKELINQVNKTLLKAILDFKLLPYPPSFIAVSALWCNLEELIPSSYNVHLTKIMKLINQDHEDEIMECRRIMKTWLVHPFCNFNAAEQYPSSPVTVLLMERIVDINDCRVDLSVFGLPLPGSNVNDDGGNKRKREE